MRQILVAAVAIGSLIVGTAIASGAPPTKAREYKGVVKSSPFEMRVLIGVSADGKKLRFTYLCGTGRAPTVVFGIPIDATGHFKYTKMTGSALVWKMAGRFVTPSSAFVSLNSIACGGSKGSTKLALK